MALFKYMSEHTSPLFTDTLSVRFTQPFALNDPFEFRPFMDFEGTAEDARELVDAKLTETYGTVDAALDAMAKQQATDPNYPKLLVPIEMFRNLVSNNPDLRQQFMSEIKRHKAEVLDKKRMAVLWEAHWEKFRQALGQTLGIFCLTEDPTNVLMWAHYASQLFGMVVEFEESHPWFDQRTSPSDDIRHLLRVCYVQNPHPRTWKQIGGADMLYSKTAEWAYEREWRMIRPLQGGLEVSPGIICFDVPADAIRNIIFGARTTQELENKIRASIGANPRLSHVSFGRTKLTGDQRIEIIV
jgi:DUF2971 family protein